MDDYLVVDPDNGSVRVRWNYGPDESWDNGWKFVPGGEIASGVPHLKHRLGQENAINANTGHR